MTLPGRRPRIAMVADTKMLGPHPFDAVGRKYIQAVTEVVGAQVILIPALPGAAHIGEILDLADGLLFTGSVANVHPARYGSDAPPVLPGKLDPDRDALSLPLLTAALDQGTPLFCICRGFQELNVALGGTLSQALQDEPGRLDHREDLTQPLAVQYGPAHTLTLSGWFAEVVGQTEIQVNSLHGQGIATLAPRLIAEAVAPDGVIEGVRVADSRAFAIGCQWHPEWQAASNPESVRLFTAFRDALSA